MKASYDGRLVEFGNGSLAIVPVEIDFILKLREKRFERLQYLYGFFKIGQIRNLPRSQSLIRLQGRRKELVRYHHLRYLQVPLWSRCEQMCRSRRMQLHYCRVAKCGLVFAAWTRSRTEGHTDAFPRFI